MWKIEEWNNEITLPENNSNKEIDTNKISEDIELSKKYSDAEKTESFKEEIPYDELMEMIDEASIESNTDVSWVIKEQLKDISNSDRANMIFEHLKTSDNNEFSEWSISFNFIDKSWNESECVISIDNQTLEYKWQKYNIKELTDGAKVLKIVFWNEGVTIEWKKYFMTWIKELKYTELLSWLDNVLPSDWMEIASK